MSSFKEKLQPAAGGEAGSRTSDVDYRLLVPLVLNSAIIQAVYAIMRVTTSYRAIELDLPVIWIGVISAAFAILPIFLAVWVGRFMDRGNDAQACWIGAALMVVACAGFRYWAGSVTALLLLMVLLGISHLFMMASQQMLCIRCAGPRGRDAVFGNYLVASAIGQGLGPYIIAWSSGTARLPPTDRLYAIGLLISFASLVTAGAMRPAPKPKAHEHSAAVVPVRTLMRQRGLMAVLIASVITITAQDLLVIYLPLLGAANNITARDVGTLLTVRSVFSLVSRMGYVRVIRLVGRGPLTLASMMGAGISFACLALPIPLSAMFGGDGADGIFAGHRHDAEPDQCRRSRLRRRHGHGDVAAHHRQPHRPGGGAVHCQPDRRRSRRRRHFRHHCAQSRGVRRRGAFQPAGFR